MTDQPLERPLPYSAEAERSVLGAILLDNLAYPVARESLRKDDFFLDQHRRIFERIGELADFDEPIDLVTLSELLDRRGELEAAGGPSYLTQLMDGLPRATNVEHYVRIVKEKATLRRLIHTAEAIRERAFDGEEDAAAILEKAESDISEISIARQKRGPVKIYSILKNNMQRIEALTNQGRSITGIATGYLNLDTDLSGLHPGELIVLAARPSIGKSSLALNIAQNVTMKAEPQPTLFFSLEMSADSLLTRLISSVARIPGHRFRTGHVSHDDLRKFTTSIPQFVDVPLWIDDSPNATVSEMTARAQRLKNEFGSLALVIVDYLQLVATSVGRSRQEQVAEISRGLKNMAKTLNVAVIAVSQLSRAPEREDRRPHLADLRDSGALEQDADVVLFIHKPNHKEDSTPEERAKIELVIAKQRNGPIGVLDFVFLNEYTRFEQAAPDTFWDSQPE